MKKRFASIAVVAFAASGLVLLPAGVASADGATHAGGFGCTLLDGVGSIIVGTGTQVATPSGNVKVQCTTDNAYNPTGSAVIWNYDNTGYTCNGSTKWHETVSASGNASLSCHLDVS